LTPDPLGLGGSLHDVGFVPNATEYLDPLGLVIIIGLNPQAPRNVLLAVPSGDVPTPNALAPPWRELVGELRPSPIGR
jgi:hypothetical protein